jgi:UrcA family protein
MGTTQTSPKTIFGLAVTTLATAALLSFAVPAPAAAETAPAAVKVAYADLDISSQAGAKTLLRRIHVAAVEACATDTLNSPLFPRADAQTRDCVTDASNAAVAGVGSPLLARLHDRTPASTILASR